jgi:hypothetical protein
VNSAIVDYPILRQLSVELKMPCFSWTKIFSRIFKSKPKPKSAPVEQDAFDLAVSSGDFFRAEDPADCITTENARQVPSSVSSWMARDDDSVVGGSYHVPSGSVRWMECDDGSVMV